MTREAIIDVLREELKRQQGETRLSVVPVETPDSFMVIGVVDVHALAEALRRNGWR